MGAIRTVATVTRSFHNLKPFERPTPEMVQEAVLAASKIGIQFDRQGRAFARFVPSPPRGFRYEKGKLVPRFAHSTPHRYGKRNQE